MADPGFPRWGSNPLIWQEFCRNWTERGRTSLAFPFGSANANLFVGTTNIILTAPHGGSMRPSSIAYRDAGCWNSTNQSCLFVHDCADFGLHEDYVRYVCPMLQIAVKAAKAVKTLFSVFAKAMRTTCF